MASVDKELGQQLRKAGDELSKFPTQVNQLLPLLDNVENLLSQVEQSPSETIQNAYSQSMKALLAEPLLRHTDPDVKVAVASCISEITRITAPEAPYNDDQMKEVFQLIVSSFADLSDQSSRSYKKRASILETVAKVRSCVVMLDLECDGLISEMFQHFLSSIREYHPENIFTSMETIMTLVLEESEDVSLELLAPMLASLRTDNEEFSAVARKLGECVFDKCAVKLKPYLRQAVKTLGLSLDAYSNIVSTICYGTNGEVDHKEDNVSIEKLADGSKLTKTSSNEIVQVVREPVAEEAHLQEVLPEVEKSVKPILTNGMSETSDKDISNVPDSSKNPDEGNLSTLNVDVNNKQDTADVDAEKSVKVESKQEKTAKRRGKKPSSKASITKPSNSSGIGGDKETETSQKMSDEEADKSLDVEKDDSKVAHISVGEDSHVDTQASPRKVTEVTPPNSSTKLLEGEGNVSSLSPSKSLPDDESLPKNVEVSKKKDLAEEDASSLNPVTETINAEKSGAEIKSERHPEKKQSLAQEDAPSMDISDSEIKPQKRSGKKKESIAQDHEALEDPQSVAVVGVEGSNDSESKPQKLSRKEKGNVRQEDESSVDPVSEKVADGSRDSEVEAPIRSGMKKENLVQDVQSVDPPSPNVDDEIRESEDKPQKRTGKKAAGHFGTGGRSRTKKGRKMLGGRGKSKTEIEDNGDSEKKQPMQSVKKGEEESDSDTKPLVQSGNKETTSKPRVQSLKKSGKKRTVSEMKFSSKKEDTSNEKGEEESDPDTKPLVQSGHKEITSKPRVQSLKKSGKKGTASEAKLSSKKEDTSNEDKDLSEKDDGKRSAHGKNTKEKLLPKSHAKDDDQDMITSPKSVKDDHYEDPKLNSKRKRTPGKDKVSGDLVYGANLVGAKVKVWWPDDKEYYEGYIESYNHSNKKHKVSYTDGDKETLFLRKEKWEFVDDGTTQEEANEDSNPDSSAKSHSRKKAKTNSELKSKQKHMDGSSPRSGGAVGSSKPKGTSTKSGGKIDSKSKDKTSEPAGNSEDSSESDDNVPIVASKSRVQAKNKLETPKTVTKSKGKTTESGGASTTAGKLKSSSSKGKDSGNTKGKSSDSGKTSEAAGKGKSSDTSKAVKSGVKSGKKRSRGSRG